MTLKKYLLQEQGLNHFFGALEARIMEVLWCSDSLCIKEVQGRLNVKSPISFNAVMTVMNRLHTKGHLIKITQGKGRSKSTMFKPVQSKERFLHEQTKAVTKGLILEYGDLVVSHMIDALEEADSVLLQRLEDKLSDLKNRQKS